MKKAKEDPEYTCWLKYSGIKITLLASNSPKAKHHPKPDI
jgi:hypothetical protein